MASGSDNAVAVIYSTRRKAATSRPERMKAKFCDFKDSGGRQVTQKLKPLFRTLSTIPCFTAECETGFSCMNVIMNDLRSAVLIDHVSSLLFINIYGPPVYQWKLSLFQERCLFSKKDNIFLRR